LDKGNFERLVAAEKLREKIAEEAKEKYRNTVGRPTNENRYPIGYQLEETTSPKINTQKELAKLAGVGTGTKSMSNIDTLIGSFVGLNLSFSTLI
jgi:hypothetical protein